MNVCCANGSPDLYFSRQTMQGRVGIVDDEDRVNPDADDIVAAREDELKLKQERDSLVARMTEIDTDTELIELQFLEDEIHCKSRAEELLGIDRKSQQLRYESKSIRILRESTSGHAHGLDMSDSADAPIHLLTDMESEISSIGLDASSSIMSSEFSGREERMNLLHDLEVLYGRALQAQQSAKDELQAIFVDRTEAEHRAEMSRVALADLEVQENELRMHLGEGRAALTALQQSLDRALSHSNWKASDIILPIYSVHIAMILLTAVVV